MRNLETFIQLLLEPIGRDEAVDNAETIVFSG
jgi:hypothetical protein